MDNLMSQSLAFAEGAVVMVCPVLLALALKKVDLKSKEHGPVVPMVTLVVAGLTLVTSICPLLQLLAPGVRAVRPRAVSRILRPFSAACLVLLASLIAQLVISKTVVIPIGAAFGAIIVGRTVWYSCSLTQAQQQLAVELPEPDQHHVRVYRKLDSSHEFVSVVTGILFLGLEGLALEGQNSISPGGQVQARLRIAMAISFFACALGVLFILLLMVPPLFHTRAKVGYFTVFVDVVMAGGTVVVLLAILIKPMGLPSLLLLAPLLVLLMNYAYVEALGRGDGDEEVSKPASLELTKATFTGFLAVSVATFGGGGSTSPSCSPSPSASPSASPSMWAFVFLGFAATAIVSGLAWRLLTHGRSNANAETANVASLLTHLCVAIAAVPFAVLAGKALP